MKDNLSYAAGLMDGEGSILLSKQNKSCKFRHPSVSLTNTSEELIQFLKSTFGGSVKNQKTYKPHHKKAWIWYISYDAAIDFLTRIRPYMKENSKCKRADLIIHTYKSITNRNGKYTPSQIDIKLNFETTFLSS